MESTLNRKCKMCGARISDDNPDGIGYTCREVHSKALRQAVYHFYGLEIWKEKAAHMCEFFLKECANTKFRSNFRKGFFASIKNQQLSGEYRISKKMYTIMHDYLFGNEYGSNYPKITNQNVIDGFIEEEKLIYRKYENKLKNSSNPEHDEWIMNLTKKYYNEAR